LNPGVKPGLDGCTSRFGQPAALVEHVAREAAKGAKKERKEENTASGFSLRFLGVLRAFAREDFDADSRLHVDLNMLPVAVGATLRSTKPARKHGLGFAFSEIGR
jgi:hypothetical protein